MSKSDTVAPGSNQDGTRPYLLISNWAIHRHSGKLWTRPLWAKDFELHFGYIQRILLACPIKNCPPPSDFVPISEGCSKRIELAPMPLFEKKLDRFLNGIPFLLRVANACLRAEIVHFTAAGHPLLFGLLIPWLRRRGKTGIVGYVESAFWRKPASKGLARWISSLSEKGVKAAISNSHATFVTQEAYLHELTSPENSNHVIHAVWIDESNIIPEDAIQSVLSQRNASGTLRIAFFGQLRPEKGADLLVDAVKILRSHGRSVELHIFGKGAEEESLRVRSADLGDSIQWRGYLTYGPEFFQEMQRYDALVVPTRSDEQPRIVFDAFSQAVPVLASNTRGLASVVKDGLNGLLFEVENAKDIAAKLETIAFDPILREQLSRTACAAARKVSHAEMHRYRADVLRKAFPDAIQLKDPVV